MKEIKLKRISIPTSLKGKIYILFTICMLIPLISFLNFFRLQDQKAETHLYEKLTRSNQQLNEKITTLLFDKYREAKILGKHDRIVTVAQNVASNKPLNETKIEANKLQVDFNKLVKLYPHYAFMVLANPQGEVLAANTQSAEGEKFDTTLLLNKNFTQYSFFKKVLKGEFTDEPEKSEKIKDGVVVEGPIQSQLLSEISGKSKTFVAFGVPVRSPQTNQLIGVFIGFIPFKVLNTLIEKHHNEFLKDSGLPAIFSLFDQEGHQIGGYKYLNETQPVDRFIRTYPILNNQVFSNERGQIDFLDPATRIKTVVSYEQTYGIQSFPSLKWVTIMCAPNCNSFAALKDLRGMFILVLILGIGALIVGAFVMNWWALRPLTHLSNVAKNLLQGQPVDNIPAAQGSYETWTYALLMKKLLHNQTVVNKMKDYQTRFKKEYTYEKQQFMVQFVHNVEKKFRTIVQEIFSITLKLEEQSNFLNRVVQQTTHEVRATLHLSENSAQIFTGLQSNLDKLSSSMPGLEKKLKQNLLGIKSGLAGGESSDLYLKTLQSSLQRFKENMSYVDKLTDQLQLLSLNVNLEASKLNGLDVSKLTTEIKLLSDYNIQNSARLSKNLEQVNNSTQDATGAVKGITKAIHEMHPVCNLSSEQMTQYTEETQKIDQVAHQLHAQIIDGKDKLSQATRTLQSVNIYAGAISNHIKNLATLSEELQKEVMSFVEQAKAA